MVRWGLAVAIVAVLVAVTVVGWATGRAGEETAGSAAVVEHVHGLGINPADGMLYAAAHNGVFRVPADGPAARVGDGEQDTMGFTVAGANHFLASGHPASDDPGPAHLGLIESTDAGIGWRTLSLEGGADFHALRYRHNTVYGYNSTSGQLMVTEDRTTWQPRSAIPLRDFVVSPSSPDTLLATTQAGPQRSTDGGRTWKPAAGPTLVLLDWERDDRLWGITPGGELQRSDDGGATWSTAGKVTGSAVTAFAAHGDDLYVSVHERGIFHSADAGASWTQRYP
jgi:hypothetical protein